ncbi:MAG: NAD-binding protein [Mobilicoccus sp.]|nr:NAD-binding protein [Mobilicoccus sp.]
MVSPLLLLTTRRRAGSLLRRERVPVPVHASSTDVFFVVLRRMRGPLLAVIGVLVVSVIGLSLIPGVDDAGRPYRLTPFEAFYVMSYTATTIGFGEVPYAFTSQQRLWMTVCIYASVTVWAYSIAALLALFQDPGFKVARAQQRVRRRVARIREPFLVLCGYGQTGRAIARVLDERGLAFVVVDANEQRLDALAADQLETDPPALQADVRNPAMLGLAGLDNLRCSGLVAVTDDDRANLAVTMTGHLLRPDIPVVARAGDREIASHMADFDPAGVVAPDDHYGAFLVLELEHPAVSTLVQWLLAPEGSPLPEPREGLRDGPWIVVSDTRFGAEVSHDLERTGLDVHLVDPGRGFPDVAGIAGFVAGSGDDAVNLAFAARARLENPGCYIALRQDSSTNRALLEAFAPDSVYIPTDLAAKEVLARIITPLTWRFLEHALEQDDAWGARITADLLDRSGPRSPFLRSMHLDRRRAPALARRGEQAPVTIGDLLRDPDDRDSAVPATVLVLRRGEDVVFMPEESTPLREDDELLVAGRARALTDLTVALDHDSLLEYLVSGEVVSTTWVFRAWRALRADRARP